MNTKQIAVILLGTLTLPVAAADINGYRFLSGGATMDRDGWIGSLVDAGEDLKASSLGGYVHGSYDFDNQLFIAASAHYLKNRQLSFFAGLGYYFPCDENSSFYLLGGISRSGQLINFKKNTKIEEPKTIANPIQGQSVTIIAGGVKQPYSETMTVTDITEMELEPNIKAGLAPRVELGYKVAFNERLGIRAALQGSYNKLFGEIKQISKIDQRSTGEKKTVSGTKKSISEKQVTVGLALSGQYALTEQLALEAGYSWSCSSPTEKLKFQPKKGIHRGQLGLRYLF
ncbi:MAG: hypothetical protein ACMZI2_00800 [Candidatus Symbiodolus clandestinus]